MGVVVAVVVLAASGVGLYAMQGDALGGVVQQQLTRANGAEVNIAAFELQPFSGAVTLGGLQVTDRSEPSRNRFAADELSAGVSLYRLLCGQLVLENVVAANLRLDAPREQPGEVLVPPGPDEEESAAFDPAAFKLPNVGVSRLQDYFARGQEIEERLEQISRWLPAEEAPEVIPADQPQAYLEYLTARTARPPRPRVIIRQVVADDVAIPFEEVGRSRIVCENLSDAPEAAGLPVVVSIESKERPTRLRIAYDFSPQRRGAEVSGKIEGLDLKRLQESLSDRNPVRFEGGTASAEIDGWATRGRIDLGLAVQTQGMQAATTGAGFFGIDPRITDTAIKMIESIKTELRLVGSSDEAHLAFNVEGLKTELKDALVKAGKDELAGRLDALIGDKLDDKLPEGSPKADELLNAGKGALGNLLGGKQKAAETEDKEDK